MSSIRNSSRIIALIIVVMLTAFGCKSKKKAMEASNAEKERAKMEQEAALRKQQEEEARKREAEETARREEEARKNDAASSAPKARLNQYFESIAGSSSVASANGSINEALTMFASPNTPVLIVISETDGVKDYDKPTTIRDYLNYLKDQKKNINSISEVKVDGSGKITEVELRKN